MKILCPVDFSTSSKNATAYALQLMQKFTGEELVFFHCVDYLGSFDKLKVAKDILKEQAEKEMEKLILETNIAFPNINCKGDIYIASPKALIPKYTKEHDFDFVVIGSTGLTNLKNISVGSVAETVARNVKIPVLIVPPSASFDQVEDIAIGISEDQLDLPNPFHSIQTLFGSNELHFYLVYFFSKSPSNKLDVEIHDYMKGLNHSMHQVLKKESISKSLNHFAQNYRMDWIGILHKHRNWFSDLFHHSILREELFNLEKPVLILAN